MPNYSSFKCPYLTKAQIISRIESFRQEYWQSNLFPIDIEKIIETKLGLDIIPENCVEPLKMDAFLNIGRSHIVVGHKQYMDENNRFANRLRFSFAHEVGHFVLHYEIYKEMNFKTSSEYIDFIQEIPEKEYKDFEWQANFFAGNLLVPRRELSSEVDNIALIFEADPAIRGILDENPALALDRVTPSVAIKFGVSEKVITRRINDEILWPPK